MNRSGLQSHCRDCQNKAKKIVRKARRVSGPSIVRRQKRCIRCGQTKPIAEFAYDRQAEDWRQAKCKECGKAVQALRRAADPEKARRQAREWQVAHPESCRGHSRAGYHRNPEPYKAKARARANGMKDLPGSHTLQQVEWRRAMWGGQCYLRLPCCTGAGTTIDHVIPLSCGGTDWPANLRPACGPCNKSKNNRPWRNYI